MDKKDWRPVPQAPKQWEMAIKNKSLSWEEIDDLNKQAFDGYNEQALVKCEFCQWSFNPDSL